MSSRIDTIHANFDPNINHKFAHDIADKQAVQARAARREARSSRERHQPDLPPSDTTFELEAVRSELSGRLTRAFSGGATVHDIKFIVDMLPLFETATEHQGVTIVDLSTPIE